LNFQKECKNASEEKMAKKDNNIKLRINDVVDHKIVVPGSSEIKHRMLCVPDGTFEKPWFTSLPIFVVSSFLGVSWIQRSAFSKATRT
jgi:hypothetical protein